MLTALVSRRHPFLGPVLVPLFPLWAGTAAPFCQHSLLSSLSKPHAPSVQLPAPSHHPSVPGLPARARPPRSALPWGASLVCSQLPPGSLGPLVSDVHLPLPWFCPARQAPSNPHVPEDLHLAQPQ